MKNTFGKCWEKDFEKHNEAEIEHDKIARKLKHDHDKNYQSLVY